jgi:transposase
VIQTPHQGRPVGRKGPELLVAQVNPLRHANPKGPQLQKQRRKLVLKPHKEDYQVEWLPPYSPELKVSFVM